MNSEPPASDHPKRAAPGQEPSARPVPATPPPSAALNSPDSPDSPDSLDRLAPEPVPGVHVLPVAHDRIESALVVRAVLATLEPAAVAVELPTTLADAATRAADRLPRISLVLSEEDDADVLVWVAAPGETFAEALRWAGERGARRFCIDPDLPYAERHTDPLPDPYALWQTGAAQYFSLLTAAAEAGGAGDRQREAGMAYHVQRARAELDEAGVDGPLLVLVGAAHARPLAAALAAPAAAPLARVRRSRVELSHLHPESLTGLLTDAPLAHAVYELARDATGEAGPDAAPATEPPPDLESTVSRRLSLLRGGFTVHTREEQGWGSDRQHRVARYAAAHALRPLAVEAASADEPGAASPSAAGGARKDVTVRGPDRAALARVVWRVGARSWAEQTREETAPWQRRTFHDFARRYAHVTGQLVPNLYGWVVAARGVGDDNLAWEVFATARAYPWQEESAEDLATARLDGDELELLGRDGVRRVSFRRRFFRVKKRWQRVPVRERRQPADPEDWLAGFDGQGLCSYPPEDVVIEDYGRFLKKKAGGVVAAERERSEPFSTSMLDGVDVRETLRHVDDTRIWVRESGRWPGEAGSVVVIFDRDPDNEHPYLMTWLGEHEDESDMAFYSSHPGEQVVGPGILRATYGGFLMTYPPGRLFDVWQDPDYQGFREKAEVLLAAGVDYSREKLVAHVAAHPPSGRMRHYAAGQGKRIVHVPIGSLSPQVLKKIRVLHVLVGRDRRRFAADYVWQLLSVFCFGMLVASCCGQVIAR